jgi:UDP-arabinose 4-epimerase
MRCVLHLTTSQVDKIFSENAFDAVMHFAAVAYVGESTMEPLRYKYWVNTRVLLLLKYLKSCPYSVHYSCATCRNNQQQIQFL